MEISKETVQAVQELCHISDELKEIRIALNKLITVFMETPYPTHPNTLTNYLEYKGKKPQTNDITL
ncbi:hypothetical protein DIZ81_03650 [Legionella taurinensis]|nr:hypothetical protein [Legionella taurinensis]MDX1836759.1 hypothetical protein [Legionella taurinensis]PUT41182.1 hypothetical protein DB744_03650 [Legionella taurinensis]PUT42307.1 hypothetical protein DB746_07580 [Legionella taurinensis]PUT43832.1 hypothetical protein DB743_09530 [Legionella taurinensis]RJT43927.1 hypothetical protein D6J04_13635 [Legionella taurinensis]